MAKPKAVKNKAKNVEGTKMSLGILDRIMITSHLLPKEGNIIDLTIAKDISKKVVLTQDEITKYEVKGRDDGGLTWGKKGTAYKKKIQFSNAEHELMKKQVELLDRQNGITSESLDVCVLIKG